MIYRNQFDIYKYNCISLNSLYLLQSSYLQFVKSGDTQYASCKHQGLLNTQKNSQQILNKRVLYALVPMHFTTALMCDVSHSCRLKYRHCMDLAQWQECAEITQQRKDCLLVTQSAYLFEMAKNRILNEGNGSLVKKLSIQG